MIISLLVYLETLENYSMGKDRGEKVVKRISATGCTVCLDNNKAHSVLWRAVQPRAGSLRISIRNGVFADLSLRIMRDRYISVTIRSGCWIVTDSSKRGQILVLSLFIILASFPKLSIITSSISCVEFLFSYYIYHNKFGKERILRLFSAWFALDWHFYARKT